MWGFVEWFISSLISSQRFDNRCTWWYIQCFELFFLRTHMRQRGAAKKRRSLTIRSFVKVFCWYAVWPHRRGPCTGRTGRYSTAAGKLRCTAPALCAHRNKDRSLWGPRRPSILPTGSVWGAAVPSHHLLCCNLNRALKCNKKNFYFSSKECW